MPEATREDVPEAISESTGIEGARLIALIAHPDERGSVTEVYRSSWVPGIREMVQSTLSVSRAGVLRGLHFHRKQADYWWVSRGTAFVGLFDLRTGSPTRGRSAEVRLGPEEGQRFSLYIPRGVAHGYYAETDVLLQYLVDEEYTGSDEYGIAWDDPGLGIAWPSSRPVLSERDRSNPGLEEVLRDPPSFEP